MLEFAYISFVAGRIPNFTFSFIAFHYALSFICCSLVVAFLVSSLFLPSLYFQYDCVVHLFSTALLSLSSLFSSQIVVLLGL
jgi:hypothetical protein